MCVCSHMWACVCVPEVITRQVWPARCTWALSSSYWNLFTSPRANDEHPSIHISVCVCVWRISNVTKRHRQKADMGANRSYPHLNRAAWLLHVRMCYESEYGRRHMTVTLVSWSVSTFYCSQHCVCWCQLELPRLVNESISKPKEN